MKHTSGPWEVDVLGFESVWVNAPKARHMIANCHQNGWVFPRDEAVANARLIEQAPNLLKACQGLLDVARTLMPDTDFTTDKQVKAAEKAIVKATRDK